MSQLPPFFCPLLTGTTEPSDYVHDSITECHCLMTAGHQSAPGSSAFCLGKIPPNDIEVKEIRHVNDLVLCIYGPVVETGEMIVGVNLVNEGDLGWLHLLIHSALELEALPPPMQTDNT